MNKPITKRSYWIPESYAPVLSEKRNSFLRLLKNKGFKEESMTKVGLYAIGTSTTLESNKSLPNYLHHMHFRSDRNVKDFDSEGFIHSYTYPSNPMDCFLLDVSNPLD
jgi:hypothetical protein